MSTDNRGLGEGCHLKGENKNHGVSEPGLLLLLTSFQYEGYGVH